MTKAQVSLEFLLVLTAFFSALLLFIPLLNHVYHLGVFALDTRNARMFVDSVNESIASLKVFGNGSSKEIRVKPLTEWLFFSQGNALFLTIKSVHLNKEKTFSINFPNSISFTPITIKEEIIFVLEKNNNRIFIQKQLR